MCTTEAYTLERQEAPIPEIGDGEVLLRVQRVGICGSDSQVFHGLHKYAKFPLVQGHEGSAVVEKVGENTKEFKQGDAVVLFPLHYCGHCYACGKGVYNACENQSFDGIHRDGLFSEYFVTTEDCLMKVPQGMDMDTAAFVEPVAVGVSAAMRAGAADGMRIAVIGGGPIGNLTAQACRAFGAEVLLCDIEQSKLDFALTKKIQHVANTGEKTVKQAITEAFGGGCADVIIDCVGIPPTLDSAIDASANASTILIVGNFKQSYELDITRLQRREVDLIGLFLYKKDAFRRAMELLSSGGIDIGGMITAHYPLEKLGEAMDYIDNNPGKVMKIVVDV